MARNWDNWETRGEVADDGWELVIRAPMASSPEWNIKTVPGHLATSTWEQRMADRAHARWVAANTLPDDTGTRPDLETTCGSTILDGTRIRCIGCGLCYGITTVWLESEDGPMPEITYPYQRDTCPYFDVSHKDNP